MKTLPTSFWIALAILGLGTGAYAQDTNSSSAAAQPGVATTLSAAPEPLPYGVLDVLKLSQAHVGDGIIVNYILNSGTIYHLTPNDILYLRSQGVSDPVLNAMLSQRQRAEAAAAAQNAEAAQAASAMGSAPAPGQAPTQAMPSPQDQSPGIITPPTPAPPSSVYVIPYSADNPYYYPDYGYNYPSYGYYGSPYYYGGGPIVSFGFGFGGRGYYHGGYRGGYYGGGFHGGGGGYHGGGFHGGGGGFHSGGGGHGGGFQGGRR